MTAGQVVDTETAQEFITQALEKVERVELGDIVEALERKHARFAALLAPDIVPALGRQQLFGILRAIFATRRLAGAILDEVGAQELRGQIGQLLYGSDPLQARFQSFVDSLSGFRDGVRVRRSAQISETLSARSASADVASKPGPGKNQADLPENVLCDLASELLHFTEPETHWLWTRWMWDPRPGTGALPLVTMDDYDLQGRDAGETYMKVGVAVAFVRATDEAAGFARFGVADSPFGIDVFLSCVYAVYMYTTLRLRMTQEFNKVVPRLPELSRRLLGVWKLEI